MKGKYNYCIECKYFKPHPYPKGWGRCTRHNHRVFEGWPACGDFEPVEGGE